MPGPASQGLPGDFFLRNDVVRGVIQAPGRAMGPCPWGGNLIDLDLTATSQGDQLGEVSPFLALGRTVEFTSVEVTRDGSDGGPAVITATGHDAIDDFINILGIAGFTVAAIAPTLDPRLALDLDVTATYTLAPGDSFITVDYALHNQDMSTRKVLFGTLTDTGAEIELFHPGVGYGEFAMNDFITANVPTVEYVALQGQGLSYGIAPVEKDPTTRGAPLPVGGVVVEAYEQRSFSDALTPAGQTVTIGPMSTVTRSVQVLVTAGGAGQIEGLLRTIQGRATGTLHGTAPPGARVAISRSDIADPNQALVTTFVADAQGRFDGALLPGPYTAEAEGAAFVRSDPVDFTVAGGKDATVALTLPALARLDYTIRDTTGAPSPGKLFVIGAAGTPDRRFRDVIKDPTPYGVAGWLASVEGDSTRMTAHDHPLRLPPGQYRVVISRGPEWSRFEKVVDLAAGGASVDATLMRVVDTSGYLACDFHQHTFISPDSPVSPEDRLAANLADGVEYVSSSEHDVHYDFRPLIQKMGLRGLLDAGIGVETTPFDYGHFIAYPLTVDGTSPNGGALDWGDGGKGALTPSKIYDGLRGKGAQVVQVNHPRNPPGQIPYQQNFDRANLRFDFLQHTFYSDTSMLEVTPYNLGLDDGASLFAPNFDAHEVYLGFWPARDLTVPDGERQDVLVNTNLRDFFDFLSFGMTPTATGDSDTHQRVSVPSGLPRTMVKVPDDSAAAVAGGVGDAVVRTMSGASPRDVVVTNGPMVHLAAGPNLAQGGMGTTVKLPSGATQLAVHVDVQSPAWAPFDTIEIYANASFVVPTPQGQMPEPLIPALCFTSRATPSYRCGKAIGGAHPLTVTTKDLGNGFSRLEASVDTSAVISQLLAQARPGASGQDLWLVARVTGQVGLYPVIPQAVDPTVVPVSDLVAGKPLAGQGVPSLAFTNPVFVDVDGGGWRAPFAP